MEHIKSVKDAKAAGTAIGAACEIAVGDTLTARVMEALKGLPKGKAVQLVGAFWEGFDAAAPSIRGLKRIKVTKSESVRIARGIDAGLTPVASWAESVKAAPKAEAGKGSGGGRKPRPASVKTPGEVTQIKPSEAAKPEAPVVISTMATGRQLVAQLVAFEHAHKSKLSVAFINAVENLARVAKEELKG